MSVSKTLPCTKEGVSHVIGKQGSVIKQIKADSGAEVEIEDGPVIKITGEQGDVDKAVELIEKILGEQANPDYEGPKGKKLRAEANAAGDERSRLMAEATSKFDAGNKDEGHKLMAEAKAQGEIMHAKNAAAAEAILKHRNDGKGDDYLDLHGLRVDEALRFTEDRLDKLAAKGETTILELIPGAGHHSAPGKVALKPACEELLRKRNLHYEAASAGSFTVTVVGTKGAAASTTGADGAADGDEKSSGAADKPTTADERATTPVHKKPTKDESRSCCLVM